LKISKILASPSPDLQGKVLRHKSGIKRGCGKWKFPDAVIHSHIRTQFTCAVGAAGEMA
jgi:hypothetical protein